MATRLDAYFGYYYVKPLKCSPAASFTKCLLNVTSLEVIVLIQPLWYDVCARIWCVVSHQMCGVAVTVTVGHIKVHTKSGYKE